ncbi:transcriptional regulator family: Fungal Specific TF [Trichoderma aggressivum f. europaeum]|uniref:Transcriptional regulator family: Fungal Specific TF n=1 Tax=Trichoderma aggressivum f. europaeum TaxID=173218 RepID=A0AAE1IKV3_9HYPO|nr:transcriptional regulator family: Fungal Specific TF [Trichoderma aggressivum f. europaeum]
MSTRRYRSAIACQTCRVRKVRCSVSMTGVPCISCEQDQTECILKPRQGKRHSSHNHRETTTVFPTSRHYVESSATRDTANQSNANPSSPDSSPGGEIVPLQVSQAPLDTPETKVSTASSEPSAADEEQLGVEMVEVALGHPRRECQVPYYIGEQTGGPTSTMHICTTDHLIPKHLLMPAAKQTILTEDEKTFLRSKGVYSFLSETASDSLIRAYFHNVHPIMPILEADKLLEYHRSKRLKEYNLILLWGLYTISSNYVPAEIYENEGFTSRKAFKAEMFARAVCVYNNGGEKNNLILLQGALLLGFWNSDIEDHMQPWQWSGRAINLCHVLGLHRDIDAIGYNTSISERQRSLFRRLWWTCFWRDRWLSVSLGRPLRINLDESDTPDPLVSDIAVDLEGIPESVTSAFFPRDLPRLAEYWIQLIQMTKLLGKTLMTCYQLRRPKPTINQIDTLEAELMRFNMPEHPDPMLSRLATFYYHHLQLHYQLVLVPVVLFSLYDWLTDGSRAILITFYRPCSVEAPSDLPSYRQREWQQEMQGKAMSAASKTCNIVYALAQGNFFSFAGPMTPTLLVPAMQVYLLNCKFGDALSRRLGLNMLNMCMMILEELQKTYSVASVCRGIFGKAIQQLFPDDAASISLTHSLPEQDVTPVAELMPPPTSIPDTPLQLELFGANVTKADFIDALTAEASIFSFVDMLNFTS